MAAFQQATFAIGMYFVRPLHSVNDLLTIFRYPALITCSIVMGKVMGLNEDNRTFGERIRDGFAEAARATGEAIGRITGTNSAGGQDTDDDNRQPDRITRNRDGSITVHFPETRDVKELAPALDGKAVAQARELLDNTPATDRGNVGNVDLGTNLGGPPPSPARTAPSQSRETDARGR